MWTRILHCADRGQPKPTLWARLRSFLTLPSLQHVPAGIVADKSAEFGLIALMRNANVYSEKGIQAITTAGTAAVITVAQLEAGVIQLNTGASGGFTLTLPTTKAILAQFGPTILTDGMFSKWITIINNGVAQTATLTAGDASTTITGTATIATDTVRQFLLNVTAPTTITITNCGSLTL